MKKTVATDPSQSPSFAPLWIATFVLFLANQPSPAHAINLYLFPEIANTNTLAWESYGTPSINAFGQMTFTASANSGQDRAILKGAIGSLSTVIDTTIAYTEFPTSPTINDWGDVGFTAVDSFGVSSINRFSAATNGITTIAESGTQFTVVRQARINNGGAVAFQAESATQEFIAAGSGAGIVFVDVIPNLGFNHVLNPVINVDGPIFEVAYAAVGFGIGAIIKGSSLSHTTIAENSAPFSNVGNSPSISNTGVVAFTATPIGGAGGVYIGSGGALAQVADSSAEFDIFTTTTNSADGVAFRTNVDVGGHGVFTGPSFSNDRVLATGNVIPEYPSSVESVRITANSMNDHGQIALKVEFTDGTTRILRADPIGELQLIAATSKAVAAMKANGTSSIFQPIDTPEDDENLTFDYYFPTTTGQLVVTLEGEVLARIDAPEVLADGLRIFEIPVDIRRLFPEPPDKLLLQFSLTGGGETSALLLDNVRYGDVVNGDFARGNLSGWERDFSGDDGVGVAVSPFAIVPEPDGFTLAVLGLVSLGFITWRQCNRSLRTPHQAQCL